MDEPLLEKIRQQVDEGMKDINSWASTKTSIIEEKKKAHEKKTVESKENILSLQTQLNQYSKDKQENSQLAQKQQEQRTIVESNIKKIETDTMSLKKQQELLRLEMETLQLQRDETDQAIRKAREEEEEKQKQREDGATWYEERLGWRMKAKRRNTLGMAFTRLSETSDIECKFDLRVTDDNTYEVERLRPRIEFSDLLEGLNSSNNLGKFMYEMRKRFIDKLEDDM
eukprot:m.241235 g.241235  ORF g.241235 m.241235 type:complete len:227 (-) comp19186_c0_seq1:1159-1839(-)